MNSDIIDLKKRQAGKWYEHRVASALRSQGWDVIETGRAGVNDHGIDLIASKDGSKRYIQCKGWKWWRIINDDVVSQIFGSVAAVEGIDNIKNVEIYIYSPASLSPYAKIEADKLHVSFVRMGFHSWSRRKLKQYLQVGS